MTPEKIEELMTENNLSWKRIIPSMWAVEDPEGQCPQVVVSVEKSSKKGTGLLKFLVFICDVPVDCGPDFFKQFLKWNFTVQHGTFAMETQSEMSFMDTLELENLNPNEFLATLDAVRAAPRDFREKYDIHDFTIGVGETKPF